MTRPEVGDRPPSASARAIGRAPVDASNGATRAALARVARHARAPGAILALALLTVAAFALNVGLGAVEISPWSAFGILADHAGLSWGGSFSLEQGAVLWDIRLPRACMAMLVGAGLAVSGAAFQGIFRNPLADPVLIGAATGASVGAVAAIVLGWTATSAIVGPLAGSLTSLVAVLAVYLLARQGGRTEVVTLLLTGLAVNAVGSAAVGLLIFMADEDQLQDIVFWTLGSLSGTTWETVRVALPFIAAGVVLIPLFARALNLLSLGEREAGHLGLATEPVRLALMVLCALAAGGAVAVSGVIGFVGLIAPHLVRLATGPDHRLVLPACALAGASLMLLADLAARTLASPQEMPLAVFTGLIGGPFFLWLLRRTRREQGGWG